MAVAVVVVAPQAHAQIGVRFSTGSASIAGERSRFAEPRARAVREPVQQCWHERVTGPISAKNRAPEY